MSVVLCLCGCGLPAPVWTRASRPRSNLLGKPKRFIRYHHSRKNPDLTRYEPTAAGYHTECWLWTGTIDKDGYGKISVNRSHKKPHRLSYEAVHGPIPIGMQLDHLCRNRSCIRPDHLDVVSPAENTRRGKSAKLTAEQVSLIRADPRPYKEIAAEFGIFFAHVGGIKRGVRWAAVARSKHSASEAAE